MGRTSKKEAPPAPKAPARGGVKKKKTPAPKDDTPKKALAKDIYPLGTKIKLTQKIGYWSRYTFGVVTGHKPSSVVVAHVGKIRTKVESSPADHHATYKPDWDTLTEDTTTIRMRRKEDNWLCNGSHPASYLYGDVLSEKEAHKSVTESTYG